MEKKHGRLIILTSITSSCFLFVIIAFAIIFAGGEEDSYIGFGPSENLKFFSIVLDNWVKYLCFFLFIGFVAMVKSFVDELAHPLIGFLVYDPHVRTIENYFRYELQIYANLMALLNGLRDVLYLTLIMIRIDVASFTILVNFLVNIFTVFFLLKKKEFIRKGPIVEDYDVDLEFEKQ